MYGIDIKADKNRTLRFTINSMIQVKKDKGKDFGRLVSDLVIDNSFDIGLLRYLYWLGLKWEDPELTEEGAGDIMDIIIANEGIDGLAGHITDAITKALGADKNTPNPKNR
jgi:hypothetical protein